MGDRCAMLTYNFLRKEIAADERTRALIEAVAKVSASDLRVVCLSALADKPLTETAEVLGYTPEATSGILEAFLEEVIAEKARRAA